MTRKVVTALDDKIYSFDRVFPEDCNQEDIYKHVSTHVKATVRYISLTQSLTQSLSHSFTRLGGTIQRSLHTAARDPASHIP